MQTSTKNYISWTIRIVVSLLFIVSALAKMSTANLLDSPYFAISTFEVKQLYTLGFSPDIAPFFSRILIGIEMALGLLLLQNNWLKRFIIPVTIAMLVVFIGHLTYVTFLIGGNSGNCGCFGELLPMTPIEAIIKNVVAVALLAYLLKLLPKITANGNFWILTTVLFATILWIFMLAPIRPQETEIAEPIDEVVLNDSLTITTSKLDTVVKQEVTTTEIKKDSVKKPAAEVENANEPKKTKSGFAKFYSKIDSGKHILGLFVPGCDHCRDAAKELTEMRKKDASLPPLSIIFMNEEADLIPAFFKEAGATYPYKIVEIIPFYNLMGDNRNTPGVIYLWNGNRIVYYDGTEANKFDGKGLSGYLKKTKDELKK
jgi:hypothetical protein